MPEDTASVISHGNRSARSARSNANSVKSVLSTLSRKGPFHRRTTVGDDDPLETLSMADYHPPTATDEEAMAVRAAMEAANPSAGWGVPASVSQSWNRVVDRMPRMPEMPKRAKADTVEDVKRRQLEAEEREREFSLFVEEQRMLGREINPNYHDYLAEQMEHASQLEHQLAVAPPRRGPPQMHGQGMRGPPPQPGRPGQQGGFFSRMLGGGGGSRRPAAPRRPMTLAEAMAASAPSPQQWGEQYEDEYDRPPSRGPPQRPAIRRLHEVEERDMQERQTRPARRGGYEDDYGYEQDYHDAPPRKSALASERRNSAGHRTPTYYEEEEQKYDEYDAYARPPRRGGAPQRSRSQGLEYNSRGGYGTGAEYSNDYGADYDYDYGHQNTRKHDGGYDRPSRSGYGNHKEDYSLGRHERSYDQPPARRGGAAVPTRRNGGGYEEYGGGRGGYDGYDNSYGQQYW